MNLCGSGADNLMEAMDGTNKIFLSFKGQPYCSQQSEECSHRIVNNICQSTSAMVAVVSKNTAGLYAPGPNVAWTPWWINRDLLAGKEFFINPEISRWLERQRHMLHLNMEVLVLLYSQLQTKKKRFDHENMWRQGTNRNCH